MSMESASSPATGTAYLILIQVVSRAFTFLANQILLRYISPSELGASAQLEVFSISVLYFARESIRFALQRQPKHVPSNQGAQTKTEEKKKGNGQPKRKTNPETIHDLQTVVNVAYIPVFLGLLITFVLGHIQARLSRTIALEIAFFPQSLRLTCIACILELLAEPCFAIVQLKGNFRKRAAIESTAAVTRCAAACATAAVGSKHGQHVGVLPFAMGQVAFALTLLAGYLVNMRGVLDGDEIVSLLPRRIIPQGMRGPSYILGRFSKPVVTVAASLYGQNVVKHILTQGDFMTLAAMTTLEDQGLFALASNYGSLVARVVFQPVEESSRNMFGLLLGTKTVGADGKRRLTTQQVHAARQYLADILRSYMLASVLILSLGPAVVPRLLPSLLGPRWSSPGLAQLLASYCYYIPVMAFNGILEAFVSSTATPRELRAQSMWMAFCSIDLIGAAYVFLVWGKFGASGIVWANVTSMVLRIVWAYRFMTKYFGKRKDGLSIRDFLPNRRTLTSGVLASAVMSSMAKDADVDATGLTKLIGVGVAFAIMILSLEAKFLFELYGKYTS